MTTHGYEEEPIDWSRVARYFAGELTPGERREFEAWIAADPARGEEVVAARRLWDQAGRLPTPSRIDELWQGVRAGMHASPDSLDGAQPALRDARRSRREPATRARRRPAARVWLAAAVVLLLLGAGAWWSVEGLGEPRHAGAAMRLYETARGQTASVQLTDGTRVSLAPATRLVVRSFDPSGPREVELVGEAVFHVVHDEARPFLVHSAHAVTEDLGTVFAVRAYPGEESVEVLVVEGRVALRDADAPAHSGTILERGEGGRLDVAGQVAVERTVDADRRLAWSQSRLVFKRTPLREVAVELERWYDVDIEIPDPGVADRRLTLDIPAGPLSDVVDAVAVPLNLRVERNGDSIRLSP